MKLIAGCLLTVLLAVACMAASAQTVSASLTGTVQIENHSPADAATIVLLNAKDSSIVKSTITDQKGAFNFINLHSGAYLLFIVKLNYAKNYYGPYAVTEGNNDNAGAIVLNQATQQLNEVAITGKKDFVEIHSGKTVLNIEQNITAAGNSLYDVLISSPGVKVNNGDILYRGGQKALVAIDGKPVLLT